MHGEQVNSAARASPPWDLSTVVVLRLTLNRDKGLVARRSQDRDPARFAAHFRWLAASPPDPTAQRAATFVAAALIAHGQRLSSPDAVEPAPERSTVKPRAPIHDALRVASRPWAQDARDRDIALNE